MESTRVGRYFVAWRYYYFTVDDNLAGKPAQVLNIDHELMTDLFVLIFTFIRQQTIHQCMWYIVTVHAAANSVHGCSNRSAKHLNFLFAKSSASELHNYYLHIWVTDEYDRMWRHVIDQNTLFIACNEVFKYINTYVQFDQNLRSLWVLFTLYIL